MKIIMRSFSLSFILIVSAVCALGQTGTSRITGTVTDPQGAVVPDAQVTLRNEATGVTHSGKTTSAGIFAFIDIPVGEYTITVEAAGFAST
jgi:hypothetical protein